MHRLPFRYGRIFLFCWERDGVTEDELLYALRLLPVEITVVAPGDVQNALSEIASPAVIACVFVVSRKAVAYSTFAQSVDACVKALSSRREFRLFVYLRGIDREQLIAMAPSVAAVDDLVNSVQIGESTEQHQIANLVASVGRHLQQLPEILDLLKYERWKQMALHLVPLSNLVFMALFSLGWWRLVSQPQQTLESNLLPWILAMNGVLIYPLFLVFCSLGSTLRTGARFRIFALLLPLWFINTIPSSKLTANWPFLVAGFGAGILLDSSRRIWAQSRRELIAIPPPKQSEIDKGAPVAAGGRNWRMLTTGPVLESETSVFISYCRGSPWSSATASALHDALKEVKVPSFLDAEGITEATSWRHKLQQALGKATVFVAVQDSMTANSYWPTAELHAAVRSQVYSGLPSIIILRDATLTGRTHDQARSLLDNLLSQKGVDPTLLRVIDFRPDTPRNLARALTNFEPITVVNPAFSIILKLVLMPVRMILARIGVLGAAFTSIAAVVWVACQLLRFNIAAWLFAQGLTVPLLMLGAFCFGFVIRLTFASRFELRAIEAPQVFWIHLAVVLVLLRMLWAVGPTQSYLTTTFAVILGGFGFLAGCDFIAKSLPRSGKYREPPI